MKYYSEVTKKMYDTEDALKTAEAAEAKKKAEADLKSQQRASRAKEVEDAFKAAQAAFDKYTELRNKFVEDYGSYHMSYTKPVLKNGEYDWINWLFNL